METRAVGYLRVSTRDQVDHGHSLDAQETAIRTEVERRGWVLHEMVRENGSAARGKERPELERTLKMLSSGEAGVLVSTRLDRLSRSVVDFKLILEQSKREGWTIVLTELGVDFSSAVGNLIAGVLAEVAEFERELISERTKDGLAAAREKGIRIGRPRVMPARTRKRIKRERESGRSFASIASGLNEDAVPTCHGGERWHPSTIHKALSSST